MHSGPLIVKQAVLGECLKGGGDWRSFTSGALCLSVPILLFALGPHSNRFRFLILVYLALPALLNVLEFQGVLGFVYVSRDFQIHAVDLITVVKVIIELQFASQGLVLKLGRPQGQITESCQIGAGHQDHKG